MNSPRPTILLLAATLLIGCEQSPKVPNTTQKNYPALIRDSADRRAKAEREWRRMLDAYAVGQTPPDLHPVIYTPRSLLGVAGNIKLTPNHAVGNDETITLREAVRSFIDRWSDLLYADGASVSLVSGAADGSSRRLVYRQVNYGFPVAGEYGEIDAVVSKSGVLMQLDDRFIPSVELPQHPQIAREDAQKRVAGRTFSYTDAAGHEQRTQPIAESEVAVKRMVVLPIQKGDIIEVHLAWELIAGKALSWTVYLDAMTGDEIRSVPNFRS